MNAPITRDITPINAIMTTTIHAEPLESLSVRFNPIAARIQPQMKKMSNLDMTVAKTGRFFPSIRNARFV